MREVSPAEAPHRVQGTTRFHLPAALLGVPVLSLLLSCLLWWPHTVDDSLIVARYAENLARGQGAVFNPGERVEGFSSPLWVAVLACAASVGLDVVIAAKLIGAMCALAVTLTLFLLVRREGGKGLAATLVALWFSTTMSVQVYAISGLETLFYSLWVMAGVTGPFLARTDRGRAAVLVAAIVGIAASRPEGLVVAGALALCWLAMARDRPMVVGVGVAASILLALLAWRFVYYGNLLPNTYAAKPSPLRALLGSFAPEDAMEFGRAISRNLVQMFASFGGAGLLLLALIGWCCHPGSRLARAAAAALAGTLVFLVAAPEDWMTGHRFGVPALAPLLLLSGLGVAALQSARRWRHPTRIAGALALSLCAGSLLNIEASLRELRRYRLNQVNRAMSADPLLEIGRWLAMEAGPGERVLAYEIGGVGYASGLPILDHQGLIDPVVARHVAMAGGYTRVRFGEDAEAMAAVVEHCARQQPEWFLLRSRSPMALAEGEPVPEGVAVEPIQNALLARLGPRMRLERAFALNEAGTDRYLLLRRTAASAPEDPAPAAMP